MTQPVTSSKNTVNAESKTQNYFFAYEPVALAALRKFPRSTLQSAEITGDFYGGFVAPGGQFGLCLVTHGLKLPIYGMLAPFTDYFAAAMDQRKGYTLLTLAEINATCEAALGESISTACIYVQVPPKIDLKPSHPIGPRYLQEFMAVADMYGALRNTLPEQIGKILSLYDCEYLPEPDQGQPRDIDEEYLDFLLSGNGGED